MPDFALEAEHWRQGRHGVAGVDEAGRGPLAGPVVVAAVILPPDWPREARLNDSKLLTAAERETAFTAIRASAVCWKVRVVSPAEIDRLNILQATLVGMSRVVAALHPVPDHVLVDGNRLPLLDVACTAVVKGDALCNSIAAASIVAKVVRDRIMTVYGARYPQWGFRQHKGYATASHREALLKFGPSPIHRRSFRVKGVPWQTMRPSDGRENPLPPGIWSG